MQLLAKVSGRFRMPHGFRVLGVKRRSLCTGCSGATTLEATIESKSGEPYVSLWCNSCSSAFLFDGVSTATNSYAGQASTSCHAVKCWAFMGDTTPTAAANKFMSLCKLLQLRPVRLRSAATGRTASASTRVVPARITVAWV
jgi:hypothetical protein